VIRLRLNNAFVMQQPIHVTRGISGDFFCAKSIERLSVIFPLFQNSDPAQTCLRAFQDQEFE
jgi:hypothetical protein